MKFYKLTIGLSFMTLLFLTSCKKGDCYDGLKNQDEVSVDCGGACGSCLDARDSVILDYNLNYIGSELEISDLQWTGNAGQCIAGTVSPVVNEKMIQRINYFRRLVGLNDNCVLNESLFSRYQQTALVMKSNNSLSHYPPNNWSCYSSEAYDGARTSNLSLGNHSTRALMSQIRDDGAHNTPVGHRRWILHSQKTEFSYGTTDRSMSLGVMGMAGGNIKIPEFIAYPPNGYMPQPLVFNRWSFGIPYADFSSADVTMTGPDGPVSLDVVCRTSPSYGDRTMVWEPQNIVNYVDHNWDGQDITYSVTVSGVKNASKTEYSYQVTLVKP